MPAFISSSDFGRALGFSLILEVCACSSSDRNPSLVATGGSPVGGSAGSGAVSGSAKTGWGGFGLETGGTSAASASGASFTAGTSGLATGGSSSSGGMGMAGTGGVGGGAVTFTATSSTVGGVTVVSLSGFVGAETSSGSLADGRFLLTALAPQITVGGQQLDGNGDGTPGDNFTLTDAQGLFRLFGDGNGDRRVDNADFFQFRTTFGLASTNPAYLAFYDVNADGIVDNADFFQFRTRFGTSI